MSEVPELAPEGEAERRIMSVPERHDAVRWGRPSGRACSRASTTCSPTSTASPIRPSSARLRPIASPFDGRHVDDSGILAGVERRDTPCAVWRRGGWTGDWARRANALIGELDDDVDLLRFSRADNATGDKTDADVTWFEGFVTASPPA